jgi:hypothetical protein
MLTVAILYPAEKSIPLMAEVDALPTPISLKQDALSDRESS